MIPWELEGTTVSRASVQPISVWRRSWSLVWEYTIQVYKANMIIPQIAENLTRSGVKDVPESCPVCGGRTKVRQILNARALYCTNPLCQAKQIKAFTLFVSRDAMNIDGLSEATMEKFIAKGFIHEFADIYHLDQHEGVRSGKMEGFGEKILSKLVRQY
ncbi:MAG: hypothetical protein ACLUUO_17920 [Sellimonas intestinalis]